MVENPPTEQCSPTEAEGPVSPLLQLKHAVDGGAPSSSTAAPTPVAMEVDKDEFDVIVSEQQKLRKFVPESLRMPWERGFAGLVLNPRSNVLPMERLRESSRSAKAMDINVDPPSEQKVEAQVKSSFVLKDRTRLPWDKAQEEEREKVLAGWQLATAEAGRYSSEAERRTSPGRRLCKEEEWHTASQAECHDVIHQVGLCKRS